MVPLSALLFTELDATRALHIDELLEEYISTVMFFKVLFRNTAPCIVLSQPLEAVDAALGGSEVDWSDAILGLVSGAAAFCLHQPHHNGEMTKTAS